MREDDPKVFDEDDAALALARLVAGDQVLDAIDEFDAQWMAVYRCAIKADEAMKTDFRSTDASRGVMVAAMRAEQAELLEPANP